MQISHPDAKRSLVQRLKRVEGQLRGVQTMIEEERDCREVMQQLSAIRSALQGVNRAFLQEYASGCLLEMEETSASRAERERMVQDLIAFLDKAP